jgi:hypothetical protein
MKTTAGSRARYILVRVCVFAALFAGLAVPLSAHPAGDFLPPVSGPVTLLVPGRIKDASFLPDTKDNPLFLAYEEMLGKLEAKHIQVGVRSLAVFEDGFLLDSSATPATVRYILKYKLLDDRIVWTESGEGDAVAFNLTVPDSGSFRITFPAKDWLLFSANRPPAPADDPSEAKKPESEKRNEPAVSAPELVKALPDDIVMAYVWPEPGATPEYPLLGELKSISFHVVRDAADKRPVHAEIVMPAKTPEAALKIQTACRDSIGNVYQEAAKLGKIPPELVNAFTVTRKDAEVAIHIALPDDMAKYLFTRFATALQDEVRPFAVPDKLK